MYMDVGGRGWQVLGWVSGCSEGHARMRAALDRRATCSPLRSAPVCDPTPKGHTDTTLTSADMAGRASSSSVPASTPMSPFPRDDLDSEATHSSAAQGDDELRRCRVAHDHDVVVALGLAPSVRHAQHSSTIIFACPLAFPTSLTSPLTLSPPRLAPALRCLPCAASCQLQVSAQQRLKRPGSRA